jgi:hypothetical protein
VTQGTHGSVAINPGAQTLSYTLTDAAFAGYDLFTYTISDGSEVTDTADVIIQVGRLPVATEILYVAGDPVPGAGQSGSGIPAGTTFSSFGIPSINQGGALAFSAVIATGSSSRQVVIVAPTTGGRDAVLVKAGDPVPNKAGEPLPLTFAGFHHPMLNAAGVVAFVASVAGAGVSEANDLAIFSNESGQLRMVAWEGGQAPGIPGAVFDSFESVTLGASEPDAGESFSAPAVIAFVARLREGVGGVTSANDLGLWRYQRTGAPQALDFTLLLRKGATLNVNLADKVPPHVVSSFTALKAQPGAAGQGNGVLFDPHGLHSQDLLARVRFVGGGSAIVEFHSNSDLATYPVATSDEYATLGIPTQSSDGQNAFVGTTRITAEGDTNTSNDSVVMVANDLDGPSVHRVAREGEPAPGVADAHFKAFQSVVNNGIGAYAFTATIAGGDVTAANNNGVWLHRADTTELLAREGAPAPGIEGAFFTSFESLASSGDGRPLLAATVQKANGVAASGIWFTDDDSALRLVLREGDVIRAIAAVACATSNSWSTSPTLPPRPAASMNAAN